MVAVVEVVVVGELSSPFVGAEGLKFELWLGPLGFLELGTERVTSLWCHDSDDNTNDLFSISRKTFWIVQVFYKL